MSLDQRQQRQPYQQENKTVSTTNHGLQQMQQHILRETQQQRLERPGQENQTHPESYTNESYLISPLISPQTSTFDAAYFSLYEDPRMSLTSYDSYPDQPSTSLKGESGSNFGQD